MINNLFFYSSVVNVNNNVNNNNNNLNGVSANANNNQNNNANVNNNAANVILAMPGNAIVKYFQIKILRAIPSTCRVQISGRKRKRRSDDPSSGTKNPKRSNKMIQIPITIMKAMAVGSKIEYKCEYEQFKKGSFHSLGSRQKSHWRELQHHRQKPLQFLTTIERTIGSLRIEIKHVFEWNQILDSLLNQLEESKCNAYK